MSIKKLIAVVSTTIMSFPTVSAHCPLCTVGAAAAAGGAAYLGISQSVIGVFIGGFSVALGLWISRIIKKKVIPFQKTVITLFSFLSTVLPLIPLMKSYSSYYLSIAGSYGTFLNRTYLINEFFVGSILGSIIVLIAPLISSKITEFRGENIPYQGMSITFGLLFITGIIIQVLL